MRLMIILLAVVFLFQGCLCLDTEELREVAEGIAEEGDGMETVEEPEPDDDLISCRTYGCFIGSSMDCTPASFTNTSTVNIFGMKQTTTTYLEIEGMENGSCLLYIRTEEISVEMPEGTPPDVVEQMNVKMEELEGADGRCLFPTDELTAVLERWEAGVMSTKDYDNANCSGELFPDQEPVLEVEEPEVTPPTEEPEPFTINASFCRFYGDADDLSSHNYLLYSQVPVRMEYEEEDVKYELMRRDDYCLDKETTFRVYCTENGSGRGRKNCPDETTCFEGACIPDSEYSSLEKCSNKSGGDGTIELCSGYEYRHDSGIILRPTIILSQFGGAAENIVMRVEGADLDELTNQPSYLVGYQRIEADSGKIVYYSMLTYNTEKVAFELRTKGGIDPASYNLTG